MNALRSIVCLLACLLLSGCASTGPSAADTAHRTIYEVNLRQYSEEGTIDAFREHLPRLERMGVGILWFMPIHPIGEDNRKGSLGSYYSVRDYSAVNPEFGSLDDMRALVREAHERDMLVILDWVPNHTAWDNVWTKDHIDWYTEGPDGGFMPPNRDWDDVIDLNYDNPEMRAEMIDAMRFWVQDIGIDGFRQDVAELVPGNFWSEAHSTLESERPLFMLAEGHAGWLLDNGFDATYGWGVGDTLINIVAERATARDLREHVENDQRELSAHGQNTFRMIFTTNHDWNSWNGLAVERLGEAWDVSTVLTFTLPGMPMIYSGQEAGLAKQLEFFEKDPIHWHDHPVPHPAEQLYTKLAHLKRENPALRHGIDAGAIEFFDVPNENQLLAFRRSHGEDEVVVLANLTDEWVVVPELPVDLGRSYRDLDGVRAFVPARIEPWGYRVLVGD